MEEVQPPPPEGVCGGGEEGKGGRVCVWGGGEVGEMGEVGECVWGEGEGARVSVCVGGFLKYGMIPS